MIHVGASAVYNAYPEYEGSIVVQNVSCTGVEFSPLQCGTSQNISSECRLPGKLAAVLCDGESPKSSSMHEIATLL